jgi:secernin
MCDTMVALGNSTADCKVLFAKNSDRQPNECHIMIRVPRRKHAEGSKVKCTYIEIEQAEETYEVLLLKPYWIWGAEMGCNEYGLNIGNEAVFTKEPNGKESLIGMDMLRIALERCKTSKEAVDLIVQLLEMYGQGGNCGYEKPFTYHNSFLIADRTSAWVLETAGEYWAALQVKDVYSISNRLSIGSNFDLAHPQLISHAIEKGWCKGKDDFSFSRCYSDPLITKLSGSGDRQSCSSTVLEENKGNITVDTMKSILRSHTQRYDSKPYTKSSISSVCMHAGFLFGDQTTGSYIASLGGPIDTYWVTGGSAPCISLFKPLWMIDVERITFGEDNTKEAVIYWKRQEELYRSILEQRVSIDEYIKDRDQLEMLVLNKVNAIDFESDSLEQMASIMDYTLAEEKKLQDKYLNQAKGSRQKMQGNLYFKYYWKKMKRKLSSN